MNQARFNSLDDVLRALPRALPPERDLWPAVARRIGLAATPGGPAARPPGARASHDASYLAARRALVRSFNERLELLAPAARARLRADLDTIRSADADLSAALAQDPANPLLWRLLRSTRQQEINLYSSVAQATQPMLQRST